MLRDLIMCGRMKIFKVDEVPVLAKPWMKSLQIPSSKDSFLNLKFNMSLRRSACFKV